MTERRQLRPDLSEERHTAIGYLVNGASNMMAVRLLMETSKAPGQLDVLTLAMGNLLGLAIELMLKAYLLHYGSTEKELTRFKVRHNLPALLDMAKAKGLVDSSGEIAAACSALDENYREFRFRYPSRGLKIELHTSKLYAALGELDFAVRSHFNMDDYFV